jgi:acyl-CoA synthetase (AMP-forming)/AMP-acid ligase II
MSTYDDWSLAGWRTHLPGVADVQEHVAGLGDETIPALAAAAASRVPDRVAVTVDGEPVTHAGLDDESGRVAAWLAKRVHPGDRVLLAAGASIGFVRCYLGALRAGAVVVLANPAYTAAELGHLVTDSGAVLAFTDPEPRAAAGRAGTRGIRAAADGRRPGTARTNQASHRDGAPARRYGAARVHLGHDRQAQGGSADPPPGDGLDPRGDGGLAMAFR